MGGGKKLKTMHHLLFRRFNKRVIVDFESNFEDDVVGDRTVYMIVEMMSTL